MPSRVFRQLFIGRRRRLSYPPNSLWLQPPNARPSKFVPVYRRSDSTARSRAFFIERSEDLPESVLQRGIVEKEAEAAQSDVREHRVGLEVVGLD